MASKLDEEKPYSSCLGLLEWSFWGTVNCHMRNPMSLDLPRCEKTQASHVEPLSGKRDAGEPSALPAIPPRVPDT